MSSINNWQLVNRLSDAERDSIADIINEGLRECNFPLPNGRVTKDDIDKENYLRYGSVAFHHESKNSISQILANATIQRVKNPAQYYKYTSVQIALEIINTKSIQVSNLIANEKEDYSEYTYFHRVIGEKQVNKFFGFLGKGVNCADTPFQIIRDNIFILCLTNTSKEPKFWDKYDLAIRIDVNKFNYNEFNWLADFRDVIYDRGYDFDFINSINYFLNKKHGLDLFIEGSHHFAIYYKREKFRWENETKLSIDVSHPIPNKAARHYFTVQTDQNNTDRKFITLPMVGHATPNPLLDFTISEVICGNRVSLQDYQQLETSLAMNFPNAKMVRI